MVNALGYDIGGANTKAALLTVKNGKVEQAKVKVQYFPIWKEPNKLADVLLSLKKRLDVSTIDGVALTMTAELSDAYQTKREGVYHILSSVKKAFPNIPLNILDTRANFLSFEESIREPLSVASANWAATGLLVAQQLKNAIVVDVGSTSTSIIPIINSKLAAQGKNDLEKLMNGELVYTGSLRTNVSAIVQLIPCKGGMAKVSSELFSLSGDVHLILGHIQEADYSSETADGRGKTIHESLARLARVVCADTEMLSKQEIVTMANYIYKQQVDQIAAGIKEVYVKSKSLTSAEIPVVITGLGKDFLARKAAEQIGDTKIIDLEMLLPSEAILATPAFGVALLLARRLEGD